MPIMTPSEDTRTLLAAVNFALSEGERLAALTGNPEHIESFHADLAEGMVVLRSVLDGVDPCVGELRQADQCFERVEQATLAVHREEEGRTAFLHTVEFLRDSLAFLTRNVG